MNDAGTVAVAFCPLGSVLVKDGKPLIFPFKFVYAEDRWVTEPVDPSGGDLIPIPDCTRKTTITAFEKLNNFCHLHVHLYNYPWFKKISMYY